MEKYLTPACAKQSVFTDWGGRECRLSPLFGTTEVAQETPACAKQSVFTDWGGRECRLSPLFGTTEVAQETPACAKQSVFTDWDGRGYRLSPLFNTPEVAESRPRAQNNLFLQTGTEEGTGSARCLTHRKLPKVARVRKTICFYRQGRKRVQAQPASACTLIRCREARGSALCWSSSGHPARRKSRWSCRSRFRPAGYGIRRNPRLRSSDRIPAKAR